MKFSRWWSARDIFFWIGVSGMIITAMIHLVLYLYLGSHITDKFNFYLVWIIFLIVGLFKKK
ncbi:MAG: hypothetical protein KFF73_08055 [Cyclobacteriaceae bacterium]|nr:hypothetical protein [Cyclobacteriaceae bacterium]